MARSISIVIDADIARSSGESEHPISSSSRYLLDTVKTNNHKIAICSTLMGEWKKHQSLFAKRWLASMIARKKVNFIKPPLIAAEKIGTHIENEQRKEVAIKDAHLIDAALLSDKIIASNDNKAREAFCYLSESFSDIQKIAWFNAISDKDFFHEFLKKDCLVPQPYYLLPKAIAN